MSNDSCASCVVSVLPATRIDKIYSYIFTSGDSLALGSIVRIPLRSRCVLGVVWESSSECVDLKKLRTIEKVFDCPPIDESMRRFVDRVAAYTLFPRGILIKMLLSVPSALDPKVCIGIRRTALTSAKKTSARKRVLECIAIDSVTTRAELARKASVSVGVVDDLLHKGFFEKIILPCYDTIAAPDPDYQSVALTEHQIAASKALIDIMKEKKFSVSLLYGVTGSGKTEVYFEVISACLRAKKQILILFPEIALTQIFLERFEARFGQKPFQWHSNLSSGQRKKIWRDVAEGKIFVVVGARSALFLPFKHLGLIIVDEEHDPGYKQEDHVPYHARDMSVLRGYIGHFPVILSSATPSVETMVNAFENRYSFVKLPARFANVSMPEIRSLDMRQFPPKTGNFLSPLLIDHVRERLLFREQSLLFLNRRGYSPLTLCQKCGNRLQCPNCTAWLVDHRARSILLCHYCGYSAKPPEVCSVCQSSHCFVSCGPGVEKIAEEVAVHFPESRTMILSSDSSVGLNQLRLDLEMIARGEVDIIIGTQLVAKGHNFPFLTLIGVVDADLALWNGDPRGSERTFQLLHQVIGRAGRTGKKSLALLQTYQPEHPLMKIIVSGDFDIFYTKEIEERQRNKIPPFGRFAAIIISSLNRSEAENYAKKLRNVAPNIANISIFGPAEAPLTMVRGRHRMRLLIHGEKKSNIQAFIQTMFASAPSVYGSILVQIDIDPQNFL